MIASALLACLLPLLPVSAKPTFTRMAPRYLHTRNGRIVDRFGRPVTISGINWFGMETAQYAPQGLDQRAMDDILAQMRSLGFNTIRLPYSDQIFEQTSMPTGINYQLNPQLAGLSGLQIMDAVVNSARTHGMWVILDRHRPDESAQSALWYTATVPETEWIADLKTLAERYNGNDTVIGIDLHNEPHDPATWGSGDLTTDWRLAAERGGNAVLSINPNLLIFVEGVQTYTKQSYWWGGNLMGAAQFPVELAVANHLVYEVHDYPSSVGSQPWFSAASYPQNLPAVWNQFWGYLADRSQTPVLLGEFGTQYQTDSDQQWLASLVNYVSSRNVGAIFWCINPDSSDTGGILENDWKTVQAAKIAAIAPVLTLPTAPAMQTPRAVAQPHVAPKDLPPFVPAPQNASPRHDMGKNHATAPPRAGRPLMVQIEPDAPAQGST